MLLVTLTSIAAEPFTFSYEGTDAAADLSDVAAELSGMRLVLPGQSIRIEGSRLDVDEINCLVRRDLASYSVVTV